jgi:DNA-binding MarR family transcriptional regulator
MGRIGVNLIACCMQLNYITPMRSRKDDIRFMVAALMAAISSTARASKKGNAATLVLLQSLAAIERARPSDLATALEVHPSTVSRQLQSLEEEGLITLTADSEDRRSCFVALTARGRKHLGDLHAFGLSRFELFVADWNQEEIHTLGALLAKLEAAKARVAESDQAPPAPSRAQRGRSWQGKSSANRSSAS